MSVLEDTIKLVRDHDAARPRSLQAEPGWSEVGGCRSYLGFRLSGAWPSDDTDSWGAIRGTAIHEYLAEILAGQPGVRTEVTTSYRGIPGHADLVIIDDAGVWDFKTTRKANSLVWREKPSALRQKRIQAHGYAAGLIEAGELPEDCKVGLIVIPVDGRFADWWVFEEKFDRALADEGADRLEWVRARLSGGLTLPKDEPYSFCESWCLAGETEVVTGAGIRPIRDLAGASHSLLVPAPHGQSRWQDCDVRSYGAKPLMAVTLRRLKSSKTIYATADHRWITRDGETVQTSALKAGTRLRSIRRNTTANLAEVPFAVAQGFVYGDGTTPGGGAAASLMLYEDSPKPKSMLGYFTGHDIRPVTDPRTGASGWLVPMLPRTWKMAPDFNETRSFLLSWLAGYIAADGTVSAAGQTTISSSRCECIDLVRSVCAIVGVGYSPVRVESRVGFRQKAASDLFTVTLRTRDLPEWAFKHEHHRLRAEVARGKKPNELNWVVESVTETNRVEEIYCADVPGTRAFALADELLTHNCEFASSCRTPAEALAAAEITDPELTGAVAMFGEATAQASAAAKVKKDLDPLVRGLRGITPDGWRVSLGEGGESGTALDEEWIRADYAARGVPVPEITTPGSRPRLTVSRIKAKAAKS